MKNFCKKFIVFLGIISAVTATINLTSANPTYAEETRSDGSNCTYFLGMTNWDCHFNRSMTSEQDLTGNIVIIASNILTDISVIAAYLVIGYVIYGGYLYMFSSGDPGKAAAGKKTLTHAFIGLAIVMSAYAIFSGIRIAIVGNNSFSDCGFKECVTSGDMIVNLIHWFGGIAGVVSAIFLVVGGWGYITAAGDPNKLQKAKNTILYSIIGLVVVALSTVITAFVSNLIRESNSYNGYTESSQIIANTNKENVK